MGKTQKCDLLECSMKFKLILFSQPKELIKCKTVFKKINKKKKFNYV